METAHYLRPALAPRSLAVVGATDKTDSLGHYVLKNVMAGGFNGPVYPINPKYKKVAGHDCFPNLSALPAPPELAVVVTPARTLPDLVDDAGKGGVRTMLVLSAGFAEVGEEGCKLQNEMFARARKHGIRLLGPNCLGLMRPDIGLNATFARSQARAGSVALVSQSGAVVAALLDYAWSAGFGFSSVVSTGGGLDVEASEILDFLALDAATRSILMYVEGVHDARAFVSSVRAAASVKPVVVLKVGRYMTGSKAAMSHTGALVGNDAVFESALRRCGAIRVNAYDQLFAAAQTLAAGRLPPTSPGNRLAVLTNGGGPGVMAADAAPENNIALAALSPETKAALDAALPATWSHGNPVDVIGDADAQRFEAAMRILLADPANDGVLMMFCPTNKLAAEDAARAVLPIIAATQKPVVTAWLGEEDAGRGRDLIKAAGLPALTSPEAGVESFSYLAKHVRNRELRLQVPPPRVDELNFDVDAARRLIDHTRVAGRSVLAEDEAKALLATFGIETARGVLAKTAEEARRIADDIGYPIVLKVRAEGITHKSEVGGVVLSLKTADEVGLAFELIHARVTQRAPQAKFHGVLVQKMVVRPHGRELIVGLARDATFGPVISFGMGGIAVEVFRDAAVALPPLNRVLAHDMISRTRVAKMLDNFRGLPAVDLDHVIDVLLRVSEMACEIPCIRELDINPLLADENGVIALDARVAVDDGPLAPSASYAHLAVHPYPKALTRTVKLADGQTMLLRPIRPEDAEADKRLVARLSPRTMYMRFHAPLRELTPERLARFTQIDYDREMAFVAIDTSGEQEEIRGVVRYTRNPDGRTAEFGVVVEDAWQGRGLGHAMMEAIEDCARDRGLEEIIGYVLTENNDMLQLMNVRGYRASRDPDDASVRRLAKKLREPAQSAAVAAA